MKVYAIILIMLGESIFFLFVCYKIDSISTQSIPRVHENDDPTFNPVVLNNLDEDVIAEREATQLKLSKGTGNVLHHAGDVENAEWSSKLPPLCIDRLRKVFPPKKVGKEAVVATQDACFSVNSGEIFGLLGANGAGKTTLLSMLTRHLIPTTGDAQIVSYSILSAFEQGSSHLGIVAQTNSLWDLLSVEDHLYLFARIRGVPEVVVKKLVEATIDQLELRPHKQKLAQSLSGGMKRKLCVAIALIGDPEVVLLDEPSAGLDPVSRRNLWNVILRTMSERAVVLTTHSMEEAEALCRRIGIMVKGQLRALGTKQHLKSKFGQGYEISIKIDSRDISGGKNKVWLFLKNHFPSCQVISENGNALIFNIPKDQMNIGLIFNQLEDNKLELKIEDYNVSQPTLEQVFIKTVQDHELLFAQETTDIQMDVVVELNKCGCSKLFLKRYMMAMFLAVAICQIVGWLSIDHRPSAFSLATVFMLLGVIGCCSFYCPCLQKPKDLDD